MKVAFTSSSSEIIDQHFGQCERFQVWEIDAEEAVSLGAVSIIPRGDDEEDWIAARAAALADCAIVCTMQIGGPAAAKLVARRIHPMKTTTELPVAEMIARLQQVLQGNPPPWLRKALHKENAAFAAE